jgi:hypothetical protein
MVGFGPTLAHSCGALLTIRSRTRTYVTTRERWTPATILEAATELLRANLALFAAAMQAVSPEIVCRRLGVGRAPQE